MKKVLSVFMVLVFAVSCLSSASAVENSDPNENIQELFSNSIPIESDVPGQYQFIAYHEPVQTRSASQQKAVTTFTIVPGNEEEAQLLDAITRTGGGSNYKYQWDNSGGVKIYSTIYYTDHGDTISLDRVTGGYDKADRSLTIVSQALTMGATDPAHTQNQTKYPSGSSWSYNAPSSWVAVDNIQGFVQYMGAYYRVDIKRSGSPWRVELINNLLNQGFWPEHERH